MPNSMMTMTVTAPLALVQGAGQNAREVQTVVKQAVDEAMQGAEAGLREARLAQQGRATAANAATIEALQGQIQAERATIDRLTGQLTSGTSKAAENAITDQIESAQERLSSLQRQMDQALGMPAVAPMSADPLPPISPDVIPHEVVQMTQMFFVTVAVIAIGIPLARAFGRWLDRRGTVQVATKPADFDPRFDRLEQAIEAIAIEVERISEGQRFTNKVMAEARALPSPNELEQWPRAAAKEPVPVERKGDR